MRKSGYIISGCLVALLVGASSAWSVGLKDVVEMPSSPNPIGSGARALGMGGAFIAIADDATAASWNPGGLIQLETPEASLVLNYSSLKEDNSFGANPEANGDQGIYYNDVNYLSAAYPFTVVDHNMIVSLNYQSLYDMNREWNYQLKLDEPWSIGTASQINYIQEGGLNALGLAYAVQVSPDISLGMTLNYWGDFIEDNKWTQDYKITGTGMIGIFPVVFDHVQSEEFSFDGWNANLGFLWRINGKLTLGGVFKTPFTADIDHKVNSTTTTTFPTNPVANLSSTASTSYSDELDMPMSYGLGVSYRFSDALSLAADIYRTQWNQFEYAAADGTRTSPISGNPIANSNIDPTTWLRLGGEYLIINKETVVPLRAGIFYDPAPAEGSPDDFYGFSLGSGIGYKQFIFDIAYQYRFGNDVGGSRFSNFSFKQDVHEHKLYSSLIVHF